MKTRPSDRVRIKRLPKRGHYDAPTLYGVLDAGLIAHVGYVIEGQPYVTPTAYWRHGDRVYWHGSSASRMLRTVKDGIPVCLAVTHLDGLVLARSGFHHSINYRSAMIFGRASLIEGEEKERALDAFVDRLMPGRKEELRPPNDQEIKATKVVGMTIEEASAKIRNGPPGDDEEDYALPVWAGVVPIRQLVGALEADPLLTPGTPVSAHLAPWRDGRPLDDILRENVEDEATARAAE